MLTAQSWTYASAVVGRTLTNSVLVSRVLTDESAGSSETHRDVQYVKKNQNIKICICLSVKIRYMDILLHSSYPGWVPGPGRVWIVCHAAQTLWRPRTASLRSRVHSGPLGWPAAESLPLQLDILRKYGIMLFFFYWFTHNHLLVCISPVQGSLWENT